MNEVVTSPLLMSRDTTCGSNADGTTMVPPVMSVIKGQRRGAEWLRGATTRWRSEAERAQASVSSATRAWLSSSSSQPLHTPFGRPDVPLVKCIGRHCQ